MNDNTVIETVTISNPTWNNVIVIPTPSTVFNKVVTTFPNASSAFYEIEIFGIGTE